MSILPLPSYSYDTDSKLYTLTRDFTFTNTGIKGHSVSMYRYTLTVEGTLYVYTGFKWDLGTGTLLDTPSLVVASLFHDIGCEMTNDKHIPYKERAQVDKHFRQLLQRYAPNLVEKLWSWARWAAVRTNSIIKGL